MPHRPYTHFDQKWITYVEIQVTAETKDVDVDVFDGGIGKSWIDLVVTAYNTQIFNSKATVYGVNKN